MYDHGFIRRFTPEIGRVVCGLGDGYAGMIDQLSAHPYYSKCGTEWVRGFKADEAAQLIEEYHAQFGRRRHLTTVQDAAGLRVELVP